MQDVIISMKGLQNQGSDAESASEHVEFITCGKLWKDGSETLFSYQESEITGMEGTETTFRVTPCCVTLTRAGTMNTHMVFERGKKHPFLYETPYGSTSMRVCTKRLAVALSEAGGEVLIDYSVDVDSAIVSKSRFNISIRVPEDSPHTPTVGRQQA